MDVFGVIGDPVSHSLSPVMHNSAFRVVGKSAMYVPMHVKQPALAEAIRGAKALGLRGLNVTIPHKEAVVPLMDTLTTEAQRVGAVNTIMFTEDGTIGHNTDGSGFVSALAHDLGLDPAGHVLLLGAGGAARGIVAELVGYSLQLTVANRTLNKAQRLVDEFGECNAQATTLTYADLASVTPSVDVVVNTTSVGMKATQGESPLPFELLRQQMVVVDIIYSPQETLLLQEARRIGCRCANGVGMLVWQAAKAWQFWFDQIPPVDHMYQTIQANLDRSQSDITR